MGNTKTLILGLVAVLIVGGIVLLESQKSDSTGDTEKISIARMSAIQKAMQYDEAKEIVSPSGFINTEPFKLADYIGKQVILVDFWTYSCINCQRTLPYLNAWNEKYKDKGLLIVGIHTPEFDFEKEKTNVEKAAEKFGVTYPVVLDNDYATWRAYGNRYWPRKYLIDIDGFIVYDHIGEGAYDETELKIQELLAERNERLGLAGDMEGGLVAPENVIETSNKEQRTPEIYFGSVRNEYLGNGVQGKSGLQLFKLSDSLKLHFFYLGGTWNIGSEYAESASAQTHIKINYRAKNVYFVASAETQTPITVLIDGKPIGDIAGNDVKDGVVTVQEDGLYHVVEDTKYDTHILELIIPKEGLKAFTFTFG